MYAGRIVESGTTKIYFPILCIRIHKGLLKCIPRLDEEKGRKLVPIEGLPPNLINMPATCAFQPRCFARSKKCNVDIQYSAYYISEMNIM